MGEAWHVEAQLKTGRAALALMRHGPAGPLRRTHRMAAPTASLFLNPGRVEAVGRYGAAGGFGPFGPLVLVPADLPLQVCTAAVPPRTLISCQFDRVRFEALAGPGAAWDGRALQACLDVRAGAIEAALQRLARETECPGFASTLLVDGIATALMVELARYVRQKGDRTRQRGGLAPWQLARLREALDREGPPAGLAELARLCGIGERHLMRAFRQSTGQTIMHYVEGLRADRARTLLAATDLPLATIAARLGFAAPGAFSRAFCRLQGEPPSAYRRRRGS